MAVVGDVEVKMTGDSRGLDAAMRKARKSTDGMEKSTAKLTRAIGSLGLAFAGGMLFKGIFAVNRETQKLKASLKTVTGSADNATKAFAKITKFAAETPFQISEVATSFIKLKAFGLDPSERALRAYGDTASAMGKSMDQMIEAVADAATGEFERLKEFGIKAKIEGDNVSFTFRGITTTIKKSAEDVQEYLLGLGETDFSGAMADQMKTLDGQMSNMVDSAEQLARMIGEEGGLNAVLGKGFEAINKWLGALVASPKKVKALVEDITSLLRACALSVTAFYSMKVAIAVYNSAIIAATVSTTALKTQIRLLLGSTGIGLLAVGVGLLAEFLIPWDKLMESKDDTEKLAKNTKEFAEATKEIATAKAFEEIQRLNTEMLHFQGLLIAQEFLLEQSRKNAKGGAHMTLFGDDPQWKPEERKLDQDGPAVRRMIELIAEYKNQIAGLREALGPTEATWKPPIPSPPLTEEQLDKIEEQRKRMERLQNYKPSPGMEDLTNPDVSFADIMVPFDSNQITAFMTKFNADAHAAYLKSVVTVHKHTGQLAEDWNKGFGDSFKEVSQTAVVVGGLAINTMGNFGNRLLEMAVGLREFSGAANLAKLAFQSFAMEILKMVAKKAALALINALTGGSFSGFTGVGKALGGAIGGFFGFAEGGIVKEPTAMVGLHSGMRGIMGEAGPEAIVPLGGNAGSAGGISLTVNVFGSVGIDDIGDQLVNQLRRRGIG